MERQSRKRTRNTELDMSNPRNWNKAKLLEEIETLGVVVVPTWKIDILRTIYELNLEKANADKRQRISVERHTDREEDTRLNVISDQDEEQATGSSSYVESITSVIPRSNIENNITTNEDARATQDGSAHVSDIAAQAQLTSAKALADMVGLVRDIVNGKATETKETINTLESAMTSTFGPAVGGSRGQTYSASIKKTGTVYAEDVPKMDNVSLALRK